MIFIPIHTNIAIAIAMLRQSTCPMSSPDHQHSFGLTIVQKRYLLIVPLNETEEAICLGLVKYHSWYTTQLTGKSLT